MDRETQKDILYESLLDLTIKSLKSRYFSPRRILGHVKELFDNREIPSQTFLYDNLEELVDENKAEKIVGETGSVFGSSSQSNFYRAIPKK